MRTYKHLYYDLLKEKTTQARYQVLYFNTLEEMRKLREIAEALHCDNQVLALMYLEEWKQMYAKED